MLKESGEGDLEGLWWLAALGIAGAFIYGVLSETFEGLHVYWAFIASHSFYVALLGDGSEIGNAVFHVNINTILTFIIVAGFWNYLYFKPAQEPEIKYEEYDGPPLHTMNKWQFWLVSNLIIVGTLTLLVFLGTVFYFTSINMCFNYIYPL